MISFLLKKIIILAYLEQCKYKSKKRRVINFIDDEIIDEELFSENDSYEELRL